MSVALDIDRKMDWFVVPAIDVKPGDRYANHGTVTHVYVGPCVATEGIYSGGKHSVKDGEVCVSCGSSFGSTGGADRPIVVGRNYPNGNNGGVL